MPSDATSDDPGSRRSTTSPTPAASALQPPPAPSAPAGVVVSPGRPLRLAAFPAPPLPDDLREARIMVNLDGDYGYLSDGYYRSLEAEHDGLVAIPSPQDALDAYVVPLALTKAAAAGIPVPEWEIINDASISFGPPLIAYPINPFQPSGQMVTDPGALDEAVRGLTVSGKYAMVVQRMAKDSRLDTLRLVMGRCLKPEYAELAELLWRTFRLPLARVKVIVTEQQYLLSAIEPLRKEELTQNEKAILKDLGLWRA